MQTYVPPSWTVGGFCRAAIDSFTYTSTQVRQREKAAEISNFVYQRTEPVADRIRHCGVCDYALAKEGIHAVLCAINELVHQHNVLRRSVLLQRSASTERKQVLHAQELQRVNLRNQMRTR